MSNIFFYVSPLGSDDSPGTEVAPFKTLKRVRNAIRDLKLQREDEDNAWRPLDSAVDIFLGEGHYFFDDTLHFDGRDNASLEYPMTFQSLPGQTPVLSGGAIITEWKVHEGRILKANLPEIAKHRGNFRQLFYRGQSMERACYPKRKESPYDGMLFVHQENSDNHKASFYLNTEHLPKQWAKPHLAELYAFPGAVNWAWCNQWCPVRSMNFDTGLVELQRQVFNLDEQPWTMEFGFAQNNRVRFENVLEELTEPGEWCVDFEQGVVYFWPPQDDPQPEVVVPVHKTIISLRDITAVNFRGITWAHTLGGDNYHRQGNTGHGAMVPQVDWPYVGEALHLRSTQNCLVEDCHFDTVAGNAIYIERMANRNVISRCHFDHVGANGVVVIGWKHGHPMFNTISDCHIHHAGQINNYCAGVFCGTSDGTRIEHNHIHDMPHHAVNLATNGKGRNFVEYNRIERAAQVNMDIGAINMWMDEPMPEVKADYSRSGHVVRNNYISDTWGDREFTSMDGQVVTNNDHPHGIYLDDYASNCVITHNIVVNTGQGVLIHNGQHNLVENNIFIDCERMVWFANSASERPGNEPMSTFCVGNDIVRNIYVPKSDSGMVTVRYCSSHHVNINKAHVDLWIGRMEGNIYWQREGIELEHRLCYSEFSKGERPGLHSIDMCEKFTPEQMKLRGIELSRVEANPMFADISNHNYTLLPDSPAFEQGFEKINIDEIGIRK